MSKKVVVILMGIAFLLMICGGVFLVIDNGKNKVIKDNGVREEKEVVKKTLLTEEKLENYQKDVNMTVVYADSFLYKEYPIDNFDQLSAEFKTKFLVSTKVNFKNREVNVSDIESIKGNYFNNFELTLSDIKDDEQVVYKYSNDKFIYNGGNGDACLFSTKKISDNGYEEFWEIQNKGYYVKEKNSNENVVYKTLNDCRNGENEVHSYSYETGGFSDEDFERIKDDLNTYIYKFSKINDKYLIESVKVK